MLMWDFFHYADLLILSFSKQSETEVVIWIAMKMLVMQWRCSWKLREEEQEKKVITDLTSEIHVIEEWFRYTHSSLNDQ